MLGSPHEEAEAQRVERVPRRAQHDADGREHALARVRGRVGVRARARARVRARTPHLGRVHVAMHALSA